MLFSDSLASFRSIALFFVPKDPLGSDNGPKQNLKKKSLKTCLTSAQRYWHVLETSGGMVEGQS